MSIPPLPIAARQLTRAAALIERADALRFGDPERARSLAEAAALVRRAHPPRCAAGCRVACREGVCDADAH